ncbi:MAG: D-glycerate dehydrogenase [Opitutaceae bacterium]|nr:D-glycerate dehydrogenase [Opitutaceae bacterium]
MHPTLPLVLVTNSVPDDVLAPLEGIARVVMGPADGELMPRAEVLERAPELAAIVNQAELQVDSELLARARKLRIVANVAIGANNLNLALMENHGVFATNVPHAFVESTADFTLGMLLALTRRLPEADAHVRAGAWRSFQPGRWDGVLLGNKILGLVGYGSIGQAVARRARGFGLRVLFHQRSVSAHEEFASLDRLLSESDIVSLHVPLNRDSERLIDASRLARMKQGALLINASRGRVVDETALVAALQSGRLAGAALDVFENEPAVHPALLTMRNVVLTPHIGGGTRESRFQARLHCIQDVARVLTGKRPVSALNAPRTA